MLGQDCPEGMIWNDCGTACPPTCLDPDPDWCITMCVADCFCPVDLVLDAGGNCISYEDCSESDGTAHLEIQNVNLTEGTLDIYMTNDVPVTGIQFQITGITLINVTAGEIVPNGWTLMGAYIGWANLNSFLGFSVDVILMPPSEGVLATVSFTYNDGEEICILEGQTPPELYWGDSDMPLITGEIPEGDDDPIVIPCTVGDCYENDENWIYGCTYENATNYNPDATFDNGSCDFMWGDVNHDGQLTIQDLILIVNEILNF